MSETRFDRPRRLDPWVASSLLQKAIRRGEPELAKQGARHLYRYRGAAVWRRLATIAVEDVGIADLPLVAEVTRLGTNRALRATLASDEELLDDCCDKLAAAPKERSADYLWSASTSLETALEEQLLLRRLSVRQLITLAAQADEPLIRRASAAQLACTTDGKTGPLLVRTNVQMLLDTLGFNGSPVEDALQLLAGSRAHPFCLTLPLLLSRFHWAGGDFAIVTGTLPETQMAWVIPAYAYDKHTAVGKSAIARFSRLNEAVGAGLKLISLANVRLRPIADNRTKPHR